MATMLLTSVCAMAQSNDATPLKGDVNGDGTVDVADLVAVMQIMRDGGGAVGEKMCYWYAGVNNGNAVTDENFINIASRIAESQIPEAGSVTAAGQYIYIVMPETRHLSSLTDGNGVAVEYDCTEVFGYHIYKTSEKVNGTFNYAIAETIYYWYVGNDKQESTSTISVATGTNPGWRKINISLTYVAQYTSASPLWNGASNPIQTGFTTVGCYLYLPKEYVDAGLGVYAGLGPAALDNLYQKTSRQTITINSIVYYEYFYSGVCAQFDLEIFYKI